MSANGTAAPAAAPSFANFSFSFARPSLLSRLNMNASAADPEPSPSTGSTSAVTTTTDSLASEFTPGASSSSDTRFSLMTQIDREMPPGEDNGAVSDDNSPSRNSLDRDSPTPRAGSPIAMEIDNNGDPEIVEIPPSHSTNGSRILATYRDLPVNHYFVAPPVALPYPRSPVRRFPEGHSLHTQPSLFGYLPRAPPRSPRLDPLEILELESTRERNEWEQVRNELGRSRLEPPSSTTTGPSQPHSITPSVPKTQTQINGNLNKAISQGPPSDDDYDSDSSDVELRIYNADPLDEIQTPSQPGSASGTLPPTPLGARPPVLQSLVNGAGAHRSIIERLSQGPSAPKTPTSATQAAADPLGSSPRSKTTTPAKRKVDDVNPAAPESSAKRPSPTPQQSTLERTGIPPPLRAEVNRGPATRPCSTVPQPPTSTQITPTSQTTTPRPTPIPSTSTPIPPVARSGNICRFHNRPPGRVCVRKDQCPDLHIGELQKPTPGLSFTPVPAIEPSSSLSSAPTTIVVPPAIARPMSRTPSLANAPPLGTNPSPAPRSKRPPCRFFSTRIGCKNGASCPFEHVLNEQPSRPPSRQLAPSPIPPTSGPSTTVAPVPVHFGPKAPLPATIASSVPAPAAASLSTPAPAAGASTISAPLVPAPVLATPFAPAPAPPAPAPQPVGTIRIAQPAPNHPLPAKPPAASPTAPMAPTTTSPSQTKGKKAKGKGKAAQAQAQANATKPRAPPTAPQPNTSTSTKVKIEPGSPALTTKAAKRKASGSQPKLQTRLDTGTRAIKQEEVTLYDLADDSPLEPSGSSVIPPELTGSQPRSGVSQGQVLSRVDVPQVQALTRTEVVQPQPRPIAPLPSRAAPPTASAPVAPTPTNTVLPPMNRPPPPPYRPPPPANSIPSALPQVPAPKPTPAAPPAPAVPITSVIPPTPVRPVPQHVAPKAPAANATNSSNVKTSNAPAASAPKSPVANVPITQATSAPKPPTPVPATSTDRLTIPVPPRSNPSSAPPRPDVAPAHSPPQVQTESRPRSREASREPDSRGLARKMSPGRRGGRYPVRRDSREPDRRSLMTRIDYRSNTYRPSSRSRSPPPRRYSPPPLRRRSPPPPRGRSPSPARYRDWRSRSRSPLRRPLRERFAPRPIGSRRSRSPSWSPRYSRSPSRSPGYRGRSPSRSTSRSPSISPPPRQRYEPRRVVDGYTNGSAYFPPEKNIPRAWEPEAEGSRPSSNNSTPSETMVIVDKPIRNSTPPPRNAIAALNDHESFNQSRTMDISPMSSPAQSYTGGGLGNRISDLPQPPAINYSPPLVPPQEQRENLLTRMTGEPDLANRLAPASSSNRGQAPNRAQPANKAAKTQPPLVNRLGGGDPYPGQASRNERRAPPRDTGVRGGKLMSRMTGK
ncbi:hypothetical protein B0J17DRAFT_723202 [Rhizoctonia solani]|nr:hypothetical protein B0J17DRAFT_723202 [Rhizoctonia solani]